MAEKVMAEIFLSDNVFLSPHVIELEGCREVQAVIVRLEGKAIKIGYVPVPKEKRILK